MGAEVVWDKAAKTVNITGKAAGSLSVPAWPWPYKKLDPKVVKKRGYELYFKGGCMYGAAAAILFTLQEEVGFPYTTIPGDMFKYGAGGAVSWGTLCGALNGAGAMLNLVNKDYSKVLNELIGWYTEYPFPSKDHEDYCKFKNQVTTVAKSPLCHASVSLWVNAAGAKVNSDEKKDRCGKLTGDTAAKAVELLNALVDGNFIAAYKVSTEFEHCMTCHWEKGMDNEQGKMNCVSCHDDHTKK
ncbi:split soret cytochrome c precursor [Clostridiales bacterium PH28_bin88]|nr:split soret cytochrome c precursor [Clostridiales bacterium PH28_bin88]